MKPLLFALLTLSCVATTLADRLFVQELFSTKLSSSHAGVISSVANPWSTPKPDEVDGSPSKLDKSLFGWIKKGNVNRVKALLMLGADPNVMIRGKTALDLAAAKGNGDIVIELLKGGAKIDMVNKKGDTALIVAVRKQQLGSVVVLVVLGADQTVVNKKGYTALGLAKAKKYKQIIAFLKQHGTVDPNPSRKQML